MLEKKYVIRSDDFLINFTIVVQMLLYGITMVTESSLTYYANFVIGIIALAVFWVRSTKQIKNKFMLLFLLYVFLYFLVYLIKKPSSVISILVSIFTYTSTACLLFDRRINKTIMLFIYYGALAFILSYLISIGFSLVDRQSVFAKHSMNYSALFVAVYLIPYYMACQNRDEVPSPIPAYICFVVSVLSYGRGGIIMGGILVGGTIIKNVFLNDRSKVWKKILILISLAIVSYYAVGYYDYYSKYFLKFSTYGMGSSREYIWREYIANALSSLDNILFGYNTRNSSLLTYYNGNLHNSYLMLHKFWGIIGFIITSCFIFRGMRDIFTKKKYDLFVLLFAILAKSFTDWNFPMQIGDICLWIVILYPVLSLRVHANQYI